MDRDHLVAEAVGGMQEIAGIRQKDEFVDQFVIGASGIGSHHVSENLNCGAAMDSGLALQPGRFVSEQIPPAHQSVPIALFRRNEIRKLCFTRRQDRPSRSEDRYVQCLDHE